MPLPKSRQDSADKLKSVKQFVDNLAEAKGLCLSPETRHDCVVALRVAGFPGFKTVKDHVSLATKVVEATLAKAPGALESPVTSGGRVTVAAVVSAGQNCPRCGSRMTDVKLGDGSMAGYCTNPRCRVSAYRS